MLEWLKTILGAHYTEEIDKKVSEEVGKGFVARADFNAANEAKRSLEGQIAERDKQLANLTKNAGDAGALADALKKAKEDNETAAKAHADEISKMRLDAAVEKALTSAGAKNATAARALLADFLKDAKAGEDGTVRGLSAEIEALVKAEGTAFLFNAKDAPPVIHGMKPAEAGDTPPAGTQTAGTSAAMNQILRGTIVNG
ncbi:MAG: phage scaffolding protein [Oscillospiraceae bacterium]|jgi:hypothetical protein|nr:phage scaffolding protein [Oscillospiraceae bacterium]